MTSEVWQGVGQPYTLEIALQEAKNWRELAYKFGKRVSELEKEVAELRAGLNG